MGKLLALSLVCTLAAAILFQPALAAEEGSPMGEDAWMPSRPHAFGPQLREGCQRAAGR
jgi:hypothetical protein